MSRLPRSSPLLPLALLALAVFAGGCEKSAPASAGAAAPKGTRAFRVAVAPVETRALAYAVTAVGSLEAHEVVAISARVEGALEKVAFDEGKTVTPDDVLAEIDTSRYSLRVREAETEVARAEAAVARAALQVAQSDATIARARAQTARAVAVLQEGEANLARRRELIARDAAAVSREELATFEAVVARARAELDMARGGEHETQTALEVVRGQAAEAKAALDQARARLDIARKNLEDSRVRSPIAGIVQQKRVASGQYLKVGEPIATLVDARRLRLRFRVGEAESVHLKNGQAVAFRVKAFPERPFDARLFHIHAVADPVTRMVECVAEVADPDPALKPGFFATVRMEVARNDRAVVIPEAAALPTEVGFVAFTVETGKARQRLIVLGLHTPDGGVEVLSGLAPGEVLVVQGAPMLQDGVPVDVVAPDGSAPPRSEK